MSEETKTHRPLLRLFPVLLCNLIAFGVTIPILPALVKQLGGGGTEVGALFTLQALGQLLMAPMWGYLSDRLGRKPILLVTILGAIITDLLTSQATGQTELYAIRFVSGLCAGTIATASAYIADVTDTKTRSKGMAVIGISFGLGFTIGPALGAGASYIAKSYALSQGFPFLVASGVNVLSILLGLLLLREGTTDEEQRSHNRERRSLAVIRELIARPGIKAMSALFLAYAVSVAILESTFYLYMADRYGYSEREVGLYFAGMGILAVFVQGGVGRISARVGDRKMSLVGLGLLSVGTAVCTGVEALWFLIPWLSILSVGRALLQPGAMSLMSREAQSESETGKVMGVMQGAQSVGRIVGPLVGGILFDQIGPRSPFLLAGILLGVVGLWWARNHRPQEG